MFVMQGIWLIFLYTWRDCQFQRSIVDNKGQGRCHALESEGAQSPKAILGPFVPGKVEVRFYYSMAKKVGGPRPPRPLR